MAGVISKVWWLAHANEELMSVVWRGSVGVGDSFNIHVCCSSVVLNPFLFSLQSSLPCEVAAGQLWLTGLLGHMGEGTYLPLLGDGREWGTLAAGRPVRVASHHQSRCKKSSTNEGHGRTYKDCS